MYIYTKIGSNAPPSYIHATKTFPQSFFSDQ